jgi:hypothetical protein
VVIRRCCGRRERKDDAVGGLERNTVLSCTEDLFGRKRRLVTAVTGIGLWVLGRAWVLL